MLRYVLAVVLTAAILAVAAVGVDHGTAVRSESAVESAIAAVDEAAVDLYATEDVPLPGDRPPQRVLTVDLPGNGFTEDPPAVLAFDRVPGRNLTTVTYRVPGRGAQTHLVDAPLVHAGESGLSLAGHTGEVTLRLELVAGDDRPVVAVSVRR